MTKFPDFNQLNLFDQTPVIPYPFTGDELRDEGIAKCEQHANAVDANWSDKAFEFLKEYITNVNEFKCENVRFASAGIIPEAINKRVWGAIILRASRLGLIRKISTGPVTDPGSHCANAGTWVANY